MCYRLANLLLRFALFYFYKYYTRWMGKRQDAFILFEQPERARSVLIRLREHGLRGLGEDAG